MTLPPLWLLLSTLYGLMSLLTFLLYAVDKRAAKKGAWRIPEQTLHLCALLCGWPGALLGQRMLRHKSKKLPFRLVLCLTIVVNLTVTVVLLIYRR